ncbi:DHA2 family efflux MFS transporter permease subunit [Aureibacillus halotolerans]|uniref:EmrB/QacA subfamily drug resistance transporter n=1 Tax=Aureibacillus halotolerans TaxID=1508390 RepID=A0A4R6U888_9BACI|nr:DHA2 family efflux MFS transporter permease subunit [Aureibacillus halotolerans]TDQ42758.1 EmrB/QacA subfamily drug resistance transporter [Aureibacillus halotolerans]
MSNKAQGVEDSASPLTSSQRKIVVAVMIMGAFVAILNQTLINVALPKIMEDLHINPSVGQWLTTVYMLVNGVLIPITAFLMERYSTRQLFLTAMGSFAIGTLVCALAPIFEVLMIGRIIQAIGAGIMMPLMTVVILSSFPYEKRGAAMGTVGIAMVFAPAVGPTLSGWLVQNYHWSSLFYVVLPIALISFVFGLIYMRNVTEQTFPKVNIPSVILSTIGFGGLLYGFSSAGTNGWTDPVVLGSLIVGAVVLVWFIVLQNRLDVPILRFDVFSYKMFSLTTIINIVLTMAMFSAMILVPLYLQNVRGFSPLESGLLLLPGAILMGIMSPITGKIFDKVGARWLAVVGLGITTWTTWDFAQLDLETTYTHMIIIYSLRMFGMSMLMMPIMTAGLNALPNRLNSHGTAMANTMRQMSGAIGTAFLVTVMTNSAKAYGESHATAGMDKEAIVHLGQVSQVQGINDAFVVATGFSLIAFVLAFFIRKDSSLDEQPNT